jgi:hypothetical protein
VSGTGRRTRNPMAEGAWQPRCRRSVRCVFLLSCLGGPLAAQDLQPRAYTPAPAGLNYFGFSYSNNRGGQLFDPSLPVEDTQVKANVASISFGQTPGVAGRTVQVLAVVPCLVANLTGSVSEVGQSFGRSGLGDAVFRYPWCAGYGPQNVRRVPARTLGPSVSPATSSG